MEQRERTDAAGQTLPPDWAPRFYQAGDDEALVELLTNAFHPWPKRELAVRVLLLLRFPAAPQERRR